MLISLVSLVLFLWTGLVACSYMIDESPNGLCRQPSWTNHTICKLMTAKVDPYYELVLKEEGLVASYDRAAAENKAAPDKISDSHDKVRKVSIDVISPHESMQ